MRWMTAVAVTALVVVGGCKDRKEAAAKADARAAGFVPPSVTSRVDWGTQTERRFRALDRNGDDFISADEMPVKNAPRILGYDHNKDGKVSSIEYSEGRMAQFDSMDLNHDGTVTSEERAASHGGQ